jgi:non-ribosomal peptide synthetase component F
MVMLAAMAVLISRETGQDDIVLGSPIANRTRRDLEPLIGCFVNTLALRVSLSGASTFRDVLARARDTCVGGYKNQEVPFDLLVKSLNLDRDLDRNPLFQVWFAMHNAPAASVGLGPVRVSHFPRGTEACRFDLEWNIWDSGGPLKIGLSYRADLFAASTAQRLLSGYEAVLNEFVGDPTATTGTQQIDRQTLSEASPEVYATEPYQEPQTALESMLGHIWADVLNLNIAVGRNDNFFELGGHSMLAVTVVERLRSQGITIDLRTLFANATIASLCMHLESAGGRSGSPDAQPEEPPLPQLTTEELSRVVAAVPGAGASPGGTATAASGSHSAMWPTRVPTVGTPEMPASSTTSGPAS